MTTDTGFPIVPCGECDRSVLVFGDLDSAGDLIARCVHCNSIVDAQARDFVDADELRRLGYSVEGTRSPHGERGCRDGGCGVQQPDQ